MPVTFATADYDLTDWASNNMNWSDVAEYAEKLPMTVKPYDYEDGWCNADKMVFDSKAKASKV